MAGSYAGTVIALPLSGVLAVNWGWESVFYVFGVIGLIWFLIWIAIVKRSPNDDARISQIERNYINEKLGIQANHNQKFSETPWKSIFSSVPVLAIVVAHFSESWGFFTLLTELPSFLKGLNLNR